ncbi:hypothetical protein [Pseudonocardia endophytica]|uniref:Uncharacterized protein n=1 Tax=Pseudonocardia endophytica TaxID=401976 RepID=A0A4R1I0T3_PSEEN|nr:hypothetical protein [Pseudonocardia endophytica]TCK27493.1 hypothetical protein EV378_3365 [Pseudonocardia endophytica]
MGEQWTTTSTPTLLRRNRPDDEGEAAAYRVYDPGLLAGRNLSLTAAGKTESPYDVAQGLGMIALLAGSAIVAPIVFSDGGFWSTALWVLAGSGAAFVVLMVLFFAFVRDPFEAYRRRHGQNASPFVEVDAADGSRAGTLCALAESITSTAAWRDGAIDPERLVPETLWSAVRLAARVADEQGRLADDERRGTSERVLEPSRTELAAARSDLEHIERNLREIGRIAREIDARPTGAAPGTVSGPTTRTAESAVAGTDAILAQSQALRDMLR